MAEVTLNEAVEAAALALVCDLRPSRHGQLCPVWTRRRHSQDTPHNLDRCDCWVVANARRDALVAVRAAAPLLGVTL